MRLIKRLAIIVLALHASNGFGADKILKASHQWPGGKGDVRDEMVQILARELQKADVGLKVLADAWLAGGFASKKGCITGPESIRGQVIRAAGPACEPMLARPGASISSSEVYTAKSPCDCRIT